MAHFGEPMYSSGSLSAEMMIMIMMMMMMNQAIMFQLLEHWSGLKSTTLWMYHTQCGLVDITVFRFFDSRTCWFLTINLHRFESSGDGINTHKVMRLLRFEP